MIRYIAVTTKQGFGGIVGSHLIGNQKVPGSIPRQSWQCFFKNPVTFSYIIYNHIQEIINYIKSCKELG